MVFFCVEFPCVQFSLPRWIPWLQHVEIFLKHYENFIKKVPYIRKVFDGEPTINSFVSSIFVNIKKV